MTSRGEGKHGWHFGILRRAREHLKNSRTIIVHFLPGSRISTGEIVAVIVIVRVVFPIVFLIVNHETATIPALALYPQSLDGERASAAASGRKGRERERRPVFHTWLCYVETERHREIRTDRPTTDRGSPHRVDTDVEATVSQSERFVRFEHAPDVAQCLARRTIIPTVTVR